MSVTQLQAPTSSIGQTENSVPSKPGSRSSCQYAVKTGAAQATANMGRRDISKSLGPLGRRLWDQNTHAMLRKPTMGIKVEKRAHCVEAEGTGYSQCCEQD